MASASYSCVIRVTERRRAGGFWLLTSRDLPGLLLLGEDRDALREDVPRVIQALFKVNYDMDISLHQVVDLKAVTEEALTDHLAASRAWSAVPIAA